MLDNLLLVKPKVPTKQFSNAVKADLACWVDMYFVHQIQQPIPKLRIRIFTNILTHQIKF